MNKPAPEQALHYLQSGQLKKAEGIYDSYCPSSPQDYLSWHYWCITKIQRKDYQAANKIINQLLDNDKEHCEDYYLTKARILTAQKKLSEAEKIYLQLIDNASDKANLHLQCGTFYYHTEQVEKAIAQYKLALSLNQHPEIRFNYALALTKNHQLNAAAEMLKTVINQDQQHLKAHYQLAEVLREQQQYKQAIPYYEKVLASLPQHVDARLAVAYCLEKQGLEQEAINELINITKDDTKVIESHELLAKLYGNRREHKLAIKHYQNCIGLKPSIEHYYNIGVHYMDLQHFQEAESYFKQVIQQDSKHYPTLQNLGAIYLKMRNIPAALNVYKKLELISPHPEEIRHILSALEEKSPTPKPPPGFISRLFDSYAVRYDEHLTAFLEYKVPEAMKKMLENSTALDNQPLQVIDIGCGTGLSAPWLKEAASEFTGIDLSSDMLAIAKQKNIYSKLILGDIQPELEKTKDNDLIIAADVLTYFGDLKNIIQSVYNCLRIKGYFIFSVERCDQEQPYILHHSLRYAHNKQYILELSKNLGFTVIDFEQMIIRKDHGRSVEGYLVLIQK